MVPLPVVGEVRICSDDDVDEREGGRGVAKTVDIPELGGVGVDDPPPDATGLFWPAVTAAVRAQSCDCTSSALWSPAREAMGSDNLWLILRSFYKTVKN